MDFDLIEHWSFSWTFIDVCYSHGMISKGGRSTWSLPSGYKQDKFGGLTINIRESPSYNISLDTVLIINFDVLITHHHNAYTTPLYCKLA
jgi:hypothetical protein